MHRPETLDLTGKRVLIRVDYNVPLNDHQQITDDTRIRATLPTIEAVLAQGASVVLMSHLGRPKGGPEDKFSLRPIVEHLSNLLRRPVQFANDCIGKEASDKAKGLKAGDVLLLENLRFYAEEEKGDVGFAEKLASLGDVYLNDAFGTAHRAHASTAVIAQFFPNAKGFGYVMANEIANVGKVLNSGKKPVTAIIGGAKVSSKITIIENLLPKINHLIIGGGMAYTFAKAQGAEVGKSLVEDEHLTTAKSVLEKAKALGVEVHLPVDSVNADAFSNDANTSISPMMSIPANLMGLDVGPQTRQLFRNVLLKSKTILWNGPVGVFELPNFATGTIELGKAILQATQSGAFSLVGGGDSVAAVKQFGWDNEVSYVSTGGGAMLEYLEGKSLPGIDAVLK